MEDLKLNTLYAVNEDFRNFVNKNAKTYNKPVDAVLKMQITKEYALYLIPDGKILEDE